MWRLVVVAAALSVLPQRGTAGLTISGKVLDARGRVPVGVWVYASAATGAGSSTQTPAKIAADGSFTTPRLRPGTYALLVGPAPESSMDADVDGGLAVVELRGADLSGVTITTRRYALRGRYVMRSDNRAARWPAHLHVTPLWAGRADVAYVGGLSLGAPNGEFVLRNLFGEHILRPGYSAGPERWWFDAIRLDGADVTDVPTDFSRKPDAKLEVVFTQHPARLEGTVTMPDGSPPTWAWVVAFSADRSEWRPWASRTHAMQVGRDGRYSFATRPGRLLIAAMPPRTYHAEGLRVTNFEAVAPLARAVTVADRERARVDLQLRRQP